MMERWEENEYILMAMFQKESRQKTMEEIRSVLPFIKDDEEMQALAEGTLEKMLHMTDREFLSMGLEPYQMEPEEAV